MFIDIRDSVSLRPAEVRPSIRIIFTSGVHVLATFRTAQFRRRQSAWPAEPPLSRTRVGLVCTRCSLCCIAGTGVAFIVRFSTMQDCSRVKIWVPARDIQKHDHHKQILQNCSGTKNKASVQTFHRMRGVEPLRECSEHGGGSGAGSRPSPAPVCEQSAAPWASHIHHRLMGNQGALPTGSTAPHVRERGSVFASSLSLLSVAQFFHSGYATEKQHHADDSPVSGSRR